MALKLEDQLGYNLNRTAMLFRRELGRSLKPFGAMTPEQWQTMNTLWESPDGLSPSEIRDITLQDLPSISRMVKRMEEHGWVERLADPEDRRSFRIKLTAKGMKLEKEVPDRLQSHFQSILGSLSKKEGQDLLSSLKKLRTALGDEYS
ncbi:MAG: MarR family transcriptional regulator [Leptospiraceae bacterium]